MANGGGPQASAASARPTIAGLLERWQSDHDADALAELVRGLRLPLERVVAQALRQRGIRDPGIRDEAVSLVLDRLWRLGAAAGRTPASRFDATRAPSGAADPGWAYILCLARSRARDVARSQARRERRRAALASRRVEPPATAEADLATARDAERLREAVATLDERSRTVIDMVLAGKSQVVIAHVLGVCEGTVSRIRSRAIARLRTTLRKNRNGGGGG